MIFHGALPEVVADETCMRENVDELALQDPLEPSEAVSALCFNLDRTGKDRCGQRVMILRIVDSTNTCEATQKVCCPIPERLHARGLSSIYIC